MSKIKITAETFSDLTTWLVHPNECSPEQLLRLCDEELCLPLIALVNQYWLIGRLTFSLQQSHVWEQLPKQLKGYLSEVEGLYQRRNESIKAEALAVCALLESANIDVALMKGSASLFNGLTKPLGLRYMNDIDLLIPEAQQSQAYQILQREGFKKDADHFDINAETSHHLPPLLRNNVCYVELHRWVLIKYLNKVLDTNDVWLEVSPLTLSENISAAQLSPTHQVILNIAHSEIANGGYDAKHIDLHQLVNLERIIIGYKEEINWQRVQQAFIQAEQLPILKAQLYIAFKLLDIRTAITDYNDTRAQAHFNACIKRYVKTQGEGRFCHVIQEQLALYNQRNIQLMYGGKGLFGYAKGCLVQASLQIRKIMNPYHLQIFIRRLLPGG